MAYETIIVEIEEGVATLTLNRPKVLNALNDQVFNELAEAAEELAADQSVRVVIITGGEKVFAAGADISQMASASAVDVTTSDNPSHRAFHLIENMPKPVIAAIAGFALGGGCELTLVTDVRIAADNAQFGLPEIKLGILPGGGGTQRLPRLIGAGRAKELIFSGDFINAEEALRIGLVNKVVPADQLFEEAKKIAKKYADRGVVALRLAKSAVNEGLRMDLEAGLEYEHKCFSLLFATEDQKEGMRAFLEKRSPKFQGK
ncbi:enoyl-CoA hydratase/isomerase family protein [Desulfosporosinus sp. BICA1-9]|uniref:enoyl-CoA hydratase/isomerase family protein n=1 Tax=Desulfosporosinus sp. BICA1-9 TaxID=1531958 RepID=UPI00054B66B2|nr:enoyl-CoA hydratase-related protein [Desulfosporosinus sp. BICA1-9]KJS48490.1 MAG: enoyl-CoA hydratase [Peptococcaceae bacterium BRH_c23]KJS90672.1 MAG: enoyl-CoA hydratase [Desulfosporosinus sp. BICA1-9]HBW34943.1 enoyl-CoA hydratase [Desulfosporosinus sp.]